MLVFVAYDISENKDRNNLIKKLRHYGLHRVQKSFFAGDLSINERLDLLDELEIFLSSERDSIMLLPACESCKESINIFSDIEVYLPKKIEFKFL